MSYIKLAKNKYNQLLLILMSLFVSRPFVSGFKLGSLVASTSYFVIIILIVNTFAKKYLRVYQALAILAFMLQLFQPLGLTEPASTLDRLLVIFAVAINSLLLGLPIYWIGRDIFHTHEVTQDTLKGGICAYVLIGYLWFILYGTVAVLEPDSFKVACEPCSLDLFHFSFTTLTTTGYGDIVPIGRLARVLANLEATIGIMYPAIFIARLVGLYSHHK